MSEEGVRELARLLTESGALPVLSRGDAGAVLVQMTIDAKDDRVARASAESMLRDGAHRVWTALGLPPFTITFAEAQPERDPSP